MEDNALSQSGSKAEDKMEQQNVENLAESRGLEDCEGTRDKLLTVACEEVLEKQNENTVQQTVLPNNQVTNDSDQPTGTIDSGQRTDISDGVCNPEHVHYKNDVAVYTDPTTGQQYEWNLEKQEWIMISNVSYGFEDDTHTYTDSDGVKYFWDKEKNAWFPKITDDFMAQYQMNYGFVDTTTDTSVQKKAEKINTDDAEKLDMQPEDKSKAIKRKPSEPTWFEVDEQQTTKVYVSNLPTDITEDEFVDFMQKCGLVMRDPHTGKMKVKLYTVPKTDILKGDALCTYIRVESVDLALKLLDGADYRGHKVKVERAKFQMKGQYDPKLKPKMKKRKEKLKEKRMQEKLFDWRPEKLKGERAKHERVVIVKNLFEPSMFDKDVGLILEFQQDLREECSKCGEVRKVMLYDRHPEGVAQINMSCPEEADECVNLLNGRWFGKRQLTAEIWDGKTKYKIAETDAQISQRLDKWDKYLESEEAAEETK